MLHPAPTRARKPGKKALEAENARLRKELRTAIVWIADLPDRVNTMLDDPSAPTTHELLPQLRAALEAHDA